MSTAYIGLALLLAASTGQAQDRSSDPLQGLTHCFGGTEFRAVSTDRLPASVTSRTVESAKGPLPVSLADGYRMMIHRQSKDPLVNLKIERSVPGQFGADRAAILLQIDRLAATSNSPQAERTEQDGIEVIGLNNPAIGTPNVISVYQLFDAATGTIATAYILNQATAVREYGSQAAYDALRDRFIGTLRRCMAHPPQ
jgi:hypothetical protein